jgi:dTDP-4-dehydrorhamnose reductase
MGDSFYPGDRPLVITGASGFLGWHLCRRASQRWPVHGLYHCHVPELPGLALSRLDLTDAAALGAWLREIRPAAVIHTAALSLPNRCEQEPDHSAAITIEATRTLAEYCGSQAIPLVFTSTDQVFDGTAAPYDETSRPNPINTYGRHKLAAEQLLRQIHPTATICRLPLLYGPATPTAECFLQGFLRTLAAGQPLRLFVDEFRSPAYVEDGAAGLLLALDRPGDLLHLGGPERINRYDFGLAMAAIFGLDATLILPSYQRQVVMPAQRPADVSSDSRRAMALGYRARGVRAGLIAVRDWRPGPIPVE